MNLILFEPGETAALLPRSDPRVRHLLEVLRRKVGDEFDAGLINGPRGKGRIASLGPDALALEFTWDAPPAAADPLTLIVGLPRPQTARALLRELSALGVTALHFAATDRGEPSYATSRLWTSGEWRRLLIAGAEQAFDTRLPEVTWGRSLADALPAAGSGLRLALDNYEAGQPLGSIAVSSNEPVTIALGAERGWSSAERDLLRERGFRLVHLGPRVLRVETAAIAAVAIIRAARGLM